MLQWELQSFLSKFLPNEASASFTVRIFGTLLVLSLVAFILGRLLKRRSLSRFAAGFAVSVLLVWGVLFVTRPAWLRIATRFPVPMPSSSNLQWITRAPGLETAELQLRVNQTVVDRMMLVRLDPRHYRVSVHLDSSGSRTAEDWQKELGAAVVVSGTYFGGDEHAPLTPVRTTGKAAGPTTYTSTHGALVTDAPRVDILDLSNRDVFDAIGQYSDAMVSYPLLIDTQGANRAVESRTWLASRNFVGLDTSDRLVLGTTETGFFTLHRLGNFLKASPLELRIALNLDGGPLVSQVVRVGQFERSFHGTAEMSDANDVLRAFWHAHVASHWTLPIVLVAHPFSSQPSSDSGN
jgi:hypothetical protein